jgi:hypothetical protein
LPTTLLGTRLRSVSPKVRPRWIRPSTPGLTHTRQAGMRLSCRMCGWTDGGAGVGIPGRTGGSEQVPGTADRPRPVPTHHCLSEPSTACPDPPVPVPTLRCLCELSALARHPAHQTDRAGPGRATGISTGRAPRDTVRTSHFHAQVHYPPTPRPPPPPVELSTPPPFPRPHAARATTATAAAARATGTAGAAGAAGIAPAGARTFEGEMVLHFCCGFSARTPVENPQREWISGRAAVGWFRRVVDLGREIRRFRTKIRDSAEAAEPNTTTRRAADAEGRTRAPRFAYCTTEPSPTPAPSRRTARKRSGRHPHRTQEPDNPSRGGGRGGRVGRSARRRVGRGGWGGVARGWVG